MRLDDVFVAGVGVYLPEPMSAEDAVAQGLYDPVEAAGSGWLGAAVAGDVPAPDMAVHAARQALARSGHDAADIALLLHAGVMQQGPDGWPSHSYVQQRVIGGDAPAVELKQGCNGGLGGLELASCFLTATGRTAALVSCSDNFGPPHFDRWRYASGASLNRASIAGDAGSAVVLSRRAGFARLRSVSSMSVPRLEEMYRSGMPMFPPGTKADVGSRLAHYRSVDPDAFAAAKDALARARTEVCKRAMDDAGVDPSRITRVTHVFSGSAGYIEAVLGPLGITPDRGMLDLGRQVGHLGCSDHFVAMDHLLTTGQAGPGDHLLMISNGGTSLTGAVVEIVEPPSWV